ncbi:MAG TPA: group II truncated hemoglobin [Myxococcota bacterium]|nr:group II truncated hemoglobin [Myxococcota bacterium]
MDPYLDLGEERGVRALVDRFYDAMETQPFATGLRAMHAADLEPMRDRLTAFLCGWLGGPPRYEERFGHVCMRGAHAPYAIDPALADAWVDCMRLALQDARLDAALERALLQAFTRTARMLVNRPEADTNVEEGAVPA